MPPFDPFARESPTLPAVRGYLHRPAPDTPATGAFVLAHGAGSDSRSPVLIAAATLLAGAGYLVLRCDLPFRQARPSGPPFPAQAPLDRDGLRHAALALAELTPGHIFLGGHSYGGRQATLLAADDPTVAAALLLLSYPLHPPRRPAQLRTAHFPRLLTPSLFVHGQRDPFGTPDELLAALPLIPAPTRLLLTPGGHDLAGFPKIAPDLLPAFLSLLR